MKYILICFILAGCSPRMPISKHITCYSGGKIIYDGYSSGRVTYTGDTSYRFLDKESKTFIDLNGECVIK